MNNDFEKYNDGIENEDFYTGNSEKENTETNFEALKSKYDVLGEDEQASPAAEDKEKKPNVAVRAAKYLFPWKGDSTKEIIRKIIFLVSAIVLIVCSVILINRFVDNRQSTGTVNKTEDWRKEGEAIEDTPENWEKLRAEYPDVEFPEGMNIKWAKLYAANQDFVGWIEVGGTNISFPLVQGKDNSEYLYLDFNRKNTNYGNPFMDYRNDIKNLNKNTLVYGHHMRDNMIFAPLKKYTASVEGFKSSPTINLSTLYADYTFKVYAAFVTNAYGEQNNGYVFNYMYTEFGGDKGFSEYIEQVDKRKLYTTGVDIKPTDKIITLNTCAYDFEEARMVIIGRLVREGEDPSVDTSKARVNQNPLWPQAYYDKKKIENPFKGEKNWYLN